MKLIIKRLDQIMKDLKSVRYQIDHQMRILPTNKDSLYKELDKKVKEKEQDEADAMEFSYLFNNSVYAKNQEIPFINKYSVDEDFTMRVMYIKFPENNHQWSIELFETIKAFCKNNYRRYITFEKDILLTGYISIILTNPANQISSDDSDEKVDK